MSLATVPPRRVIHVITSLEAGGAERMLVKLVSSMDRSRFLSSAVSLIDEGSLGPQLRELGVRVDTLGCVRGVPSLRAIDRLRRIFREQNADLVQGWMYHGNLAATLARTLAGSRSAVIWNVRHTPGTIREENVRTSAAILFSAMLSSRAACIIYNSARSANQHEALGFSKERRRIIPNGFDLVQFAPRPAAAAELRSELALPGDAVLIGHIAHFSPMKDHATFFAAAEPIARENPAVHFVLAGIGVTESNGALAERVARHGLGQRVRLLGERRDIHRWLPGLDLVVSSSAFGEGFMNVIGEAMSCAVPCVVTDVGESAHIVGDTGAVVPPRNPSAIAEQVNGLLRRNREARSRAGERARARIAEHFSLPAIAAQYEALYETTVSSRSRARS